MQPTYQQNGILGYIFGGLTSKKKAEAKSFYSSRLSANYSSLMFYKNIYDQALKDIDLLPDIEGDQLFKIIEYNVNTSEIIKKYGEPSYSGSFEDDEYKIDILVYRTNISGLNAKVEFHFLNNLLFYNNYIFEFLGKKDKEGIISTIRKKYDPMSFKSDNMLFKGNDEIKIFIQDDVVFRINYFNPNDWHFKKVIELSNNNRSKTETKSKVDLKNLLREL